MPENRTDLAMEAFETASGGALPGVCVSRWDVNGIAVTEVRISDNEAARELGKPKGTYLTLECPLLKERDPDAHQVKKGNQWYFGFKGHIGVDRDTGLVNKIETTAANVHDTAPVPDLLEGTEEEVFGDSGYLGIDQHDEVPKINREGKRIAFRINIRRSSLKKLPEAEQEKAREVEHAKSSIRCKVEHVFAVVKGMFRYRKTRLRGLPKVNAQLHMLFALANLILADRPSVTA